MMPRDPEWIGKSLMAELLGYKLSAHRPAETFVFLILVDVVQDMIWTSEKPKFASII
jgi:hypothetical protein